MSSSHRNPIGRLLACLCAAITFWSLAGITPGQTIDWNNPAGGNYNTASNWNPANVPNVAGESARFNFDAKMEILFPANGNFTIDDLFVPQGDLIFRNAGTNNDATLNVLDDVILNGGDITLLRVPGGSADVNLVVGSSLRVESGSDLSILNSAQVQTNHLLLATGLGGDSTLVVDGAGSRLSITGISSNSLIGGFGGNAGTLTFRNGSVNNTFAETPTPFDIGGSGSFSNSKGFLNVLSASTLQSGSIKVGAFTSPATTGLEAVLTVDGMGSSLTMTGSSALAVGSSVNNSAVATVQVSQRGTLTTGTGGVSVVNTGRIDVLSGGTFQANGPVSLDGSLHVAGQDGSGNFSNWNGSGEFHVGDAGFGFMTIEDGGLVSSGASFIAVEPNTFGEVTVTGAGSTWNTLVTHVGVEGQGVLTIADGGQVSNTNGSVGFAMGSEGFATVTGTDAMGNPSTWTNAGPLCVGCGGNGELTIEAGGQVTSTFASTIGGGVDVTGEVTITGTDGSGNPSTWTSHHELVIGSNGTGTLTIEAGAQLVSPTATAISSIGRNVDSIGNVTVTGTNSSWTHAGHLEIGSAGVGTMSVTDGAQVNFDITVVGSQSTSEGTVVVSGLGSAWTSSGSFHVGNIGEGTLLIEDGGSVANTFGVIAGNPISVGSVTVRGAGSTWTNSGSLYVGGTENQAGGQGTLSVNTGATVEVGDTLTIYENGAINLLGGTIVADDLAMLGSTFNFVAGTLQLGSDQTVAFDSDLGKALGHNAVLIGGQQLTIDGTLTFVTPLTLDGASVTVHNIANGSLLGLHRGTLHITQAALTIGPGGQFGDQFQLKPDVTIEVDQGTVNHGLIYGRGALGGSINNTTAGEIRAEAGNTLTFTGAAADNSGDVRLLGGIVDFHGPLTNTPAGRITGRGTLIARAGLMNLGHVALSSGITDVYGDVTNDTGNPTLGITVSGNADVTFWGDMINMPSSLFRVSSGSSATFFGAFAGAGVSGFGDVYFEADITPGSSPGLAEFGGNVHMGSLANLEIELAGTMKGSAYDALEIAGAATLGGTLDVSLLSFAPNAGDIFEILTAAGGITGTFANTILPALSGDLFWNIDYSANSVTLAVAAPELAGDHNGDGTVDAADYVIWRKTGGTQQAYHEWRSNFGTAAGGSASDSARGLSAVPEPNFAIICLFGGIFVAIIHRVR